MFASGMGKIALTAVLIAGAIGARPAAAAPACEKAAKITPGPAKAPRGSAAIFANKLRQTVAKRDLDGFMAMLAPDILSSFGGDGGVQEFREYWALDSAEGRERLWQALDGLMGYGPSYDGGEFQMMTWPWFFSTWPEDVEGWNNVMLRKGTALRARPDLNAPVVARLPRQVGEVVDEDEGPGDDWVHVKLAGRCPGYVATADAWPILGYRLLAEQRDNGWVITALVAGD